MSQVHQNLYDLHDRFSRNHDRLREQLLARITAAPVSVPVAKPARRLRLPAALAAAATLVVALGLVYLIGAQPSATNVWADTLKQAAEINSIHFIASNPGPGGKDTKMEVWWQRPNNYRMEVSNGTTITNNGDGRRILDGTNRLLMVFNPDQDASFLGDFGTFFTSENAMELPFIKQSKLIKTEPVSYKGESCKKYIREDATRRYEFIVEPKVHQIYETNYYNLGQPPRLIYHVEVLGVDEKISPEIFTVQPGKDIQVRDIRSVKLPALPAAGK